MDEDECPICGGEHPADVEHCRTCGGVHTRCSAHAKVRDENDVPLGPIRPCRRYPVAGSHVCPKHGGNLAQVRAAGRARLVEADARKALGYTLDGKVPDILAAMEGLAAMSIAMVEALAARVNALSEERYRSDAGIEQTRAEVSLLERSIDRSVKLLEVVAKHKPDGEAAAAVNLLTSLSDQIKGMNPE